MSSLNTGLEGASNYPVITGFQEISKNISAAVVVYPRRKSGLKAAFDVNILTLNRMISVSQHLDFP